MFADRSLTNESDSHVIISDHVLNFGVVVYVSKACLCLCENKYASTVLLMLVALPCRVRFNISQRFRYDCQQRKAERASACALS